MSKADKFVIPLEAARFRGENGIGPSEAISLKSLLLKLNILTVFCPLSVHFSGMCIRDHSSRKFILINSQHPRGRQHFTIAHELYHLCIEKDPRPHICQGEKTPSEKNADLFAAEILMPRDGVVGFIPPKELETKTISIATILKIEHYYAVSRTALLFRLQNIGVLTESGRMGLQGIPPLVSALDYGYDTSIYKPGNEGLVIGDFGEKARFLFDSEKISEGHYLELLHKISRDNDERED